MDVSRDADPGAPMRFDLTCPEPGRNRLAEARALAMEGEQVLVVSREPGREQGRVVGLLLDRDLVRLSRTVRSICRRSPRLAFHRGGICVVRLVAEEVARMGG